MRKRQERLDAKLEERRIADGALLDAALAPYVQRERNVVLDLRDERFAALPRHPENNREPAPLDEEIVTIVLGGRATIDVRRSQSRSSVVRLSHRAGAALAT